MKKILYIVLFFISVSFALSQLNYIPIYQNNTTTRPGKITSLNIMPSGISGVSIRDYTLMRKHVALDFKAPYADTADYYRYGGGGGGEANILGNMPGAGIGLAGTKTGVELRIARLKAGTNTSISGNIDSVTIGVSIPSGTYLVPSDSTAIRNRSNALYQPLATYLIPSDSTAIRNRSNNLYDALGAAAAVTPTTLGLVIGTNVQAYDADLTTWAGITSTTVGQNITKLTNPGAVTFLRLNADNTISALSASDQRTALGLAIGTNVQAYNSNLTGINQALTTTSSPTFINLVLTNGSLGLYGASARIAGADDEELMRFATLGGDAVNYLQTANALTTAAPELRAIGDDTNIDLKLVPKGTGVVSSTSLKLSSLTAGRIPIVSTAGLLADDANLVWDNTNKRLGIGTASPSYGLHLIDTSSSALYSAYFTRSNLTASAASRYSVLKAEAALSDNSPNAGATFCGLENAVYYNGTGTLSSLVGNFSTARNTGTSGTVANLVGNYFWLRNTTSGTVTSGYGFWLLSPTNSGTWTSNTGIRIDNQSLSGMTTIRGIDLAVQTGGTNNTNLLIGTGLTGNWSIYNNSTYDNYFAGNVGIGTTSFGTSLAKGISIGNGTAASAAATTATQLWSSTDGLNIAYTITNKWVIGDKFGAFNATAVVKQTGCAVPTDLATAITAITALRTALNNYGLTTVVP